MGRSSDAHSLRTAQKGYTPEAIRDFCGRIGVAKNDSIVDVALLENCVREDLNKRAPRVMAVLRPLRVVVDNYPEGQVEEFDCPYHPRTRNGVSEGSLFTEPLYRKRRLHGKSSKEILSTGSRQRGTSPLWVLHQVCRCGQRSKTREITEIHCTYDPETRSGFAPDGRKVDATIHWVSAAHSLPAQVRLYDRLFELPIRWREVQTIRNT